MNKFAKARFHIDLVEAASKAAIDAAQSKVRCDSNYVNYAEGESTDWYNDEWLEAHVNDAEHCTVKQYLNIGTCIYHIARDGSIDWTDFD